VESRKTTLTAAFLGMLALAGCRGGGGEELTARLNAANDKVVACRAEVNELKAQNADLKRKLAFAMANPALQLTDPEILNLIAELKSKRAAPMENGDVVLGKGALDPKDASRVVRQGAQALQKCYERALKKSSALQMQSGLGVMLELTVKPTGIVQETTMTPQVDADLTDCVRTTVARWKFPPFAGDSVLVKQKLTLTPKT
jgi:outer membrane murein-binding lipoprotein Lpp